MIERDQAIEIAWKRASKKGWEFAEPLDLFMFRNFLGFGAISRFEIWTNAGNPGAKTRFVIDAKAGKILSEEYIPQITSEYRSQPETVKILSEGDIPLIRICSVRSDSYCQTMPEQDQAIEIAYKRAEEKNWAFIWPLNVSIHHSWSGRPRRFEIMTNTGSLGAKACHQFLLHRHAPPGFVIPAKAGIQ